MIDLTHSVKICELEDPREKEAFHFQIATDSRVYYFSLDSEQEKVSFSLPFFFPSFLRLTSFSFNDVE